MTASELEREVVRATGESRRVIRQLGFQPSCPMDTIEWPYEDRPPLYVDWDEADLQRVALLP